MSRYRPSSRAPRTADEAFAQYLYEWHGVVPQRRLGCMARLQRAAYRIFRVAVTLILGGVLFWFSVRALAHAPRQIFTNPTRATTPAGLIGSAQPQPALAFVAPYHGIQTLFVLEHAQAVPRPITIDGMHIATPTWSPDGNQLVVSVMRSADHHVLYRVQADGSAPQMISALPTGGRDLDPAWSPDGQWLAFSSNREQHDRLSLYLMRPDDSAPQRLTDLPGEVRHPRWITIQHVIFIHAYQGLWSLIELDVVTHELRMLYRSTEVLRHPSLAPDGLHLIVSQDTATGTSIVQLNRMNGYAETLLSHLSAEAAAIWSPSGQLVVRTGLIDQQSVYQLDLNQHTVQAMPQLPPGSTDLIYWWAGSTR